MAKHRLLLMHGIGLHGDDWVSGEQGPVETLKRAAKRYKFFQNKPLEEHVEFVPLSYDSVFQSIIAQWQADASAVTSLPGNTLGGSLDWLAGATEDEQTFWWTHVADVALYRCFPTYRQAVRAHVMDDLTAAAQPAVDAGDNVSVIAHSMGTSVLHDVLHLVGSKETLGGVPNAFRARNFRLTNIIMLANVSRLLQTQDAEMKPAYTSIVRPGRLADAESYCSRYLNFRHEADPIPFPRMFEPVDFDPQRYSNIVIRHYWQANVHDVSHYLLNPRVHIPILRAVTRQSAISVDEEKAAVNPDNFPQIGGDFGLVQKVATLAERLAALQRRLGENPSPAVMTQAFTQYATAVREIA